MQLKRAILFALAALGGFLVSGGAADLRGGGGNFADFYRQQQIRILSAVDAELSKAAENAITGNFAAVKKAGVQLQTKLGGRTSNIGVNIIGSFAETKNEAFGWHLRGYGGDEDTFGANAGLFYREIDDGMLFGANAFVDYEDGDYGKFSRVGIGGEIKHANVGVVVNYYAPIGHDKQVNSTVAAFSRRGFDAKVRISAPYFSALKAAADYYNFAGKDGVKDEDGLRYGAELHLSPALHLGVFYDDGAEKVGGELSYLHTFNSSPSPSFPQNSSSFLRRQESITNFTPDLFAAPSREYSQRIATMAIITTTAPILTTPPPANTSIVIATMRTTTTMIAAGMTTIMSMEMPTLTATRRASVQATLRILNNLVLVSLISPILVTLPPLGSNRPFVIMVRRMLAGISVEVLQSPVPQFPAGQRRNLAFAQLEDYTITVVEGSERFISVTTTLTTETTTTMAAVTTNTTLTTFSTMTVTIGANSAAMGGMSPMDSRLRGNDGLLLRHNDGGGKFLVVAKPPPPVLVANNAMVIAGDGVITNCRPAAARHSCQLAPIRRTGDGRLILRQ